MLEFLGSNIKISLLWILDILRFSIYYMHVIYLHNMLKAGNEFTVKQDEYSGLRLQEWMFNVSVNVKLNCFYKSKDMDKHEKAWHNPYIQLLHNKIKHHNNAGMFRMMRSPGQERFLSGVELVLFCPEYKYMDDLWRSITKLLYVRGFFVY